MRSPTERILQALEERDCNPRQNGKEWTACCPAHTDHNPSLSISEGSDGRVLLYCHAGCPVDAICDAVGLRVADLMPTADTLPSKPTKANGKPATTYQTANAAVSALERKHGKRSALWIYHNAQGDPVGVVVRWDKAGGKDIRPVARRGGGWTIGGMPEPRPLYGLPDLVGAERVFITEGEKAADSARAIGLTATTSPHGAQSPGKTNWKPLAGRQCVILPDNDEPGSKYANAVAEILGNLAPAATAKVVELPGLSEHGDIVDWIADNDEMEPEILRGQLEAMVEEAEVVQTDQEHRSPPRDNHQSQATLLVLLAEGAGVELFHTPGADPDGYAVVPIGGHQETWRIGTKAFRYWLQRLFWDAHQSAPNSQALQDAIGVLRGKALFDGPEIPVFVRLAEFGREMWLDLANDEWQAVRINCDGWMIENTPLVRFVRPRGMLALPLPTKGGTVSDLRSFLNVNDDDDWLLLLAWLIAALRPTGPFPVLCIHGEQGSAKSTACRILRSLVDPNEAALRCGPRNEHDLMIAATNGWVVALENLSSIPNWLSDALCRLSTGGGFGTRELYSDGEEKLFNARRPVMINGIAELATRSDLLDRSIIINLQAIRDGQRRTEAELFTEFDGARPRILGSLLDAVSTAISNIDTVELKSPRMADFARWVYAAEGSMGCEADMFLKAYTVNRQAANESAIESSIIAEPLISLLATSDNHWEGTSTELKDVLENLVADHVVKQRAWPKRPNVLSNELNRIAPNLRRMGVDIEIGKKSGRRFIRIGRTGTQNIVHSASIVHTHENGRPDASIDRPGASSESTKDPETNAAVDDADDQLRHCSDGACNHDAPETQPDDDWGEL